MESIDAELFDDYHNLIDTIRISSTTSKQLHGTIEEMVNPIRVSHYRENFHINHQYNQQIRDKSIQTTTQDLWNQIHLQISNHKKIHQTMMEIKQHQHRMKSNQHHLHKSDIKINMKMSHHHIGHGLNYHEENNDHRNKG